MAQYVYGKNVVRQLLKDNKKIYEILLVENFRDKELEAMVKQSNVNIKVLPKRKMDQILKTEYHQGIGASIDEYKTYSIDEILNDIPSGKIPLLLMLDGLEDPQNLGAILRTCDCVGVDGVLIGKHRSVQLNATVAKTSTGAIDSVKVGVVTNLARTIQELKEKGFWVIGADIQD
ncbi:MAG: 23S rRNA (guanosine(2251)-2'-O)-methyltransferase RlmB, partial [Traorella sp.]